MQATSGYRGLKLFNSWRKNIQDLKKTTSGKSNNEQTNLQILTFQLIAN